jgi:RHS repeat-associated protein
MEFMQRHRVLSLGAPVALVCMMFMVMPGAFVSSAYAAGGSPELGANAIQYFHNDRVGSTILVTDNSGSTISKPVYKPFGEVYNNTDDDNYRYGFAGKETDGDTGLMYFGSRYYDPALGRFITADSAAIGSEGYRAGQLNRYAFTQNDPINMADPSGNLAFLTMVLIAFIVSATVSTAAELITAKVQNRAVNWTTIGIGIAVSAIMAPIGIGLGMGVVKGASMLASTRLGAASMYMSMSLVKAGVAPGVVTGAATAASAVMQTAIASAAS